MGCIILTSAEHLACGMFYTDQGGAFGRGVVLTAAGVEPVEGFGQCFGARDQVERRRHRTALLKITQPHRRARKLPLCVSVLLQKIKQ